MSSGRIEQALVLRGEEVTGLLYQLPCPQLRADISLVRKTKATGKAPVRCCPLSPKLTWKLASKILLGNNTQGLTLL